MLKICLNTKIFDHSRLVKVEFWQNSENPQAKRFALKLRFLNLKHLHYWNKILKNLIPSWFWGKTIVYTP